VEPNSKEEIVSPSIAGDSQLIPAAEVIDIEVLIRLPVRKADCGTNKKPTRREAESVIKHTRVTGCGREPSQALTLLCRQWSCIVV